MTARQLARLASVLTAGALACGGVGPRDKGNLLGGSAVDDFVFEHDHDDRCGRDESEHGGDGGEYLGGGVQTDTLHVVPLADESDRAGCPANFFACWQRRIASV